MQRRQWLVGLALALVGGLAIQPAPSAATLEAQPATELRVLNALPNVPSIDVYVDDTLVVPAIAFGAVAPYVVVAPGSHAVVVVPAGGSVAAPLVATQLLFNPGTAATAVALEALGAPPVLLLMADEPIDPALGPARVRFVHASPNAPPVDLAITGGPALFTNITFGEPTPYLPVPPGPIALEARLAGTPTVVVAAPAYTLAPGQEYTFVAIGLAGGVPPLGILSLTDL